MQPDTMPVRSRYNGGSLPADASCVTVDDWWGRLSRPQRDALVARVHRVLAERPSTSCRQMGVDLGFGYAYNHEMVGQLVIAEAQRRGAVVKVSRGRAGASNSYRVTEGWKP